MHLFLWKHSGWGIPEQSWKIWAGSQKTHRGNSHGATGWSGEGKLTMGFCQAHRESSKTCCYIFKQRQNKHKDHIC